MEKEIEKNFSVFQIIAFELGVPIAIGSHCVNTYP